MSKEKYIFLEVLLEFLFLVLPQQTLPLRLSDGVLDLFLSFLHSLQPCVLLFLLDQLDATVLFLLANLGVEHAIEACCPYPSLFVLGMVVL